MLRYCFLSSFIELRWTVAEKKSKYVGQSEAGRPSWFPDRSEKKNTNMTEDIEILLPIKFRWIPVADKKSKMSQLIRDRGGDLGLPIGPKNAHFV